jgi:putative endonuclease
MTAYWVYIQASQPHGTLYIGVTNGLLRRLDEHRAGVGSAFTRKYKVSRLVWYQEFADIEEAIQIEKRLERYVRQWKINLIERANPHWVDLYGSLLGAHAASDSPVRGAMGRRDKPDDDTSSGQGRPLEERTA